MLSTVTTKSQVTIPKPIRASLDAISIGGEAIFRQGMGPLLPGTEHVPPPDEYRCIYECRGRGDMMCARYVEYVMEKEGDIAAVLATIRYIEENRLAEHARELGKYALGRMREMMERHPLIGDVRGLGLFLGIELVKDRTTGEPASEKAEEVMYAALSRGLSFKLTMGNILTLTPALTMTREEMDRGLDIIEACLSEVEKGA
jgi:4-aminobutyrate aminotransferase-like enzyme